MRTQASAIALAVLVSLLTATGAFFLKVGASKSSFGLPRPRLDTRLFLGVCVYLIASVIYLYALRSGEVSVLFPIVSLEYVWASLLAVWRLKERVSAMRALGLAAIVLGAIFVGIGGY